MPIRDPDLHGQAPDAHPVALLLIDTIQDYCFEGSEPLVAAARPAYRQIARLAARARAEGVPVIYVNDNFGRWRESFEDVLRHACREESRAPELVRTVAPTPHDYFVLKPKHSGFYETTLSLLLAHLGVETLVLTGFSGDMCVLFTAIDAYLRDFRLVLPRDATASQDARHTDDALAYARRVLDARTPAADDVDFAALTDGRRGEVREGEPAGAGRGA